MALPLIAHVPLVVFENAPASTVYSTVNQVWAYLSRYYDNETIVSVRKVRIEHGDGYWEEQFLVKFRSWGGAIHCARAELYWPGSTTRIQKFVEFSRRA